MQIKGFAGRIKGGITSIEVLIDKSLFEESRLVVLGLSGGPDSVCLLHELCAAGVSVLCAHVHHGLRGADADADAAFVASLCAKADLPLELLRVDAHALAKEQGMTVEEAGRTVRYAFFDELCMKYALQNPCIAVAHNQDDQVETILMRLVRGTGVDGLAGMAVRRKSSAGFDIIRPLLGVSRQQIERRLAELDLAFRLDESNLKPEYFRNRLRLEILPYLEKTLGTGFRRSLLRLAENAAEDKTYFEDVVQGVLEKAGAKPLQAATLSLPVRMLADAPPALRHRLIRRAFSEIGLGSDIAAVHLAAADRLLATWAGGGEASGKYVEFPLDYTLGIAGGDVVFRTPCARKPGGKPRLTS